MSFSSIKLAVVVGVCGVVPFRPGGGEIVLGDIIVSAGAVQYDLGRRLPEHFVGKDMLLDSLRRPNTELRALLAKLKDLVAGRRCKADGRLHGRAPGRARADSRAPMFRAWSAIQVRHCRWWYLQVHRTLKAIDLQGLFNLDLNNYFKFDPTDNLDVWTHEYLESEPRHRSKHDDSSLI